ncbi:hypothetical protein BIV57_05520 [Mangrovactinospora gilvigrisea]|uniref:Copper resistance protein CopC n=1 Tax=Mangrovactinospora gilvigrisea TaxID=1428644 RepID=A0A1J7BIK1_9ACTN|nr:hypothetical protein BIV57_05520 [Mangrovactinospora gilvigrisea]
MRRVSRWATTLLAAAAAALVLLLAGAAPASAHAQLESSTPGQGQTLGASAAPGQVVLTFSESVTLRADDVRVFAPNGSRADTGGTGHAGGRTDTARVALRSGLAQGTYTVAWQAISADTHPVGGAFTFNIGHASATTAAPGEKPAVGGTAAVEWAYQIARGVAYAAFALLVGGSAFVLLLWTRGVRRPDVQRLLQGSWAALLLSTVAVLLLYGPHTAGGGPGKALSYSLIRSTLGTRLGTALGMRLLLLAVFAVFLSVLAVRLGRAKDVTAGPGRDLRWALGLVGALLAWGLAATWSAADHAAVGIQPGLALPLDMVHLMAMALWLGGLTTILLTLRGTDERVPAAAVRKFSRMALWCVAALAATGTYQSWRQVGTWSALYETDYGRTLLIKLLLVATIVGAAAASRRLVAQLTDSTPAVGAPGGVECRGEGAATASTTKRKAELERQQNARTAAARRRAERLDPTPALLRRSVLTETALAVAVLAVTTVLTNSNPARNEAAAAKSPSPAATRRAAPQNTVTIPFDTGGANGRGTADVTLDPGRTGGNTLHVLLATPSKKPMDVAELDVGLTLPARDIGPIPVKTNHLDTGHYAASSVSVPMPGRWRVAITVRTSAIDEITVYGQVTVR